MRTLRPPNVSRWIGSRKVTQEIEVTVAISLCDACLAPEPATAEEETKSYTDLPFVGTVKGRPNPMGWVWLEVNGAGGSYLCPDCAAPVLASLPTHKERRET